MDDLNVTQPANVCNAPTEPGEEWRRITDPRLQNPYWISSHGRVWSELNHMFLTPTIRHGYVTIQIAAKPVMAFFMVHRIVAELFLPVPEAGCTVVDHIDGNKQNNNVDNLKWTTQHGNAHNPNTRPKSVAACRTVSAMKGHAIKCEGFAEPFAAAKDLAVLLGVTPASVRRACRTGGAIGVNLGLNHGKGFHAEYIMNEFDAKQKPVTLDDAIAAAIAVKAWKDSYSGKPVICIEDKLPFPSISAIARAYNMAVPAVISNRQRTDSGTSKLCAKKGFRTTHHFASMSREDYLKWVDEHVPKAD